MTALEYIEKVKHDHLQRMAKLRTYGSLQVGTATITFLGVLRVCEAGLNVFRVELPDRPPIYGDWVPQFEANGNDFNVEVRSLGYTDAFNVGNKHPKARLSLRRDEQQLSKRMITEIFSDPAKTRDQSQFGITKARFQGKVIFDNDWIVLI